VTWALLRTETFLRTARRFLRRRPDLRGELLDLLQRLEENPRDPRLRLHRLKGRHKDKHAVSLTYSLRVVLVLKITEKEVLLLDLGTHDEVYR